MAQPQMIQVKLSRFDAQPWGFRLQGGTDFAAPLLVQKVNAGSFAEQAGLMPGDAVLTINDVDVFNLRHKDAQDVVVRSGNNFVITVQRGGSTWRPHVTPTGNVPQPNTSPYLQTVTKTSLQHKQQDVQHIGSGYNNSARPFTNGGDGSVKSIVNKQYNTPVGIYSDESIAETLSAQAEVLAGGVLGVNFKKNEKEYQAEKSEVLKFLREEETGGHSTPAFNNHQYQDQQQHQQQQQYQPQQQQQQQYQQPPQQQHQQQQQQQYQAPSATKHVSAPINTPKPPSTGGLPTGQNICVECERLITGVFVRIKDKNLHVECFKCATCGTSLKNQGYYNFNNKLYCDIHAKLAAMQNPPSGTEGYVPVPIKPNTKLSANTISSALSAHGFNGMGGQNGNSTPTPSSQTVDDSTDLPLPPPPSPTQLQQFEAEAYHKSISAAPPNNGYTRTPSSLSSGSCGSSMSPTPASGIGGIDMATSSTLSLDRFGSSPLHSRQTSSSASSSIGGMDSYSGAGGSPLPPPPPPPLPEPTTKSLNNQSNMKMQQQQQQQHGGKQNENDMNTQNKAGAATHNAYNKFLKEYSNKLLTQSNNNNNSNNDHTLDSPGNTNRTHNSNNNSNTINKITTLSNNTIPKPFKVNPNIAPNVAAVSAVLANQLKFNPHQVANPTATATAPPPLPQTATPKLPTSDSSTLLASSSCDSNLTAAVDSQLVPPPPPPPIASATTMMTTDELQPIYGQIGAPANPGQSAAAGQADQPFEYVTLTGNVIRSVVPPGKGVNLNYKVNQGGYARPFNAGPPAAAPKSPVSYPPQQQQQQQWGAPQPSPKPAGNPYATLPRTNAGPQGRVIPTYYNYNNTYHYNSAPSNRHSYAGPNKYATMPTSHNYSNNTSSYNSYSNYSNNYSNYNQEPVESLQPQYAEECVIKDAAGASYYEIDHEVANANRRNRTNFAWPPADADSHETPTAAPLYIAPPETQHVVARPIQQPPPPPPGERRMSRRESGQQQQQQQREQQQQMQQQQQQQQQQQLQQQQQQEQQQLQEQQQAQQEAQLRQQQYWQSRSAPQLTGGSSQPPEIESSSDSYTSTCTTTTTTSEEYQRRYAAQMQAYQMQQGYAAEQSGSEMDYHMDMEVAAMQQRNSQLQIEQLETSSSDMLSGRRSVQECAETLSAPLSTYRLVDMVREVTPSPVPPPQGPRHVVFADEPQVKEVVPDSPVAEYEEQRAVQEESQAYEEEKDEDCLVIEDRRHILESERIFQPTPEIKINIPPVRHIPPTKIPNPTPKEWINPMVRALTTAPEIPFHMMECPCPKPCDCPYDPANYEPEPEPQPAQREEPPPIKPEEIERPLSPVPQVLLEEPPKGSSLTKAMATAPEFPMLFTPPASAMIPLPDATKPYMPPPADMKPYMRPDFRPKSPFVSALTVAPERSFEGHFDRDVPIHSLDLPTPKEQLSMADALCTASERPYTPLDPENATHVAEEEQKAKEKKRYEFQVLDREEEIGLRPEKVEFYITEEDESRRKSSSTSFAAMQAFQSPRDSSQIVPTVPRNSVISLSKDARDPDFDTYSKAQERNQKRLSYYHKKEEELQLQQQQQTQETNQTTASLSSCTKQSSSSNSSSTVQETQLTQRTTATSASASASTSAYASQSQQLGVAKAAPRAPSPITPDIIDEVVDELEHSEKLFPPPSPLSHLRAKTQQSGLHRPESIPKYQRNWTALPTQSPSRTPEPQELRDNIPLAFVDAPKGAATSANHTVHRPVPQVSRPTPQQQARPQPQPQPQAQPQPQPQPQPPKPRPAPAAIPIIIEDRSGPVTMAFQSLDEHIHRDESQTPTRAYTPSLSNKPVPIVPFYQTPEKLCFDECPATHAKAYDRRSASPFPDRARSPAPGPPPNPLSAIRAPRMKDNELSPQSPRLQVGSITTGQSYLGAQQAQQQQGNLLSHYESSTQAGSQSFTENPETVMQRQMGDLTVQTRERSSRLEEQNRRQLQSATTTQVGNAQIERRRQVTEEFEHSQSAKTVEIRTGGGPSAMTERRQSFAKSGFVANQARRLSGLEQEISNLTPQSQAISARASQMTDVSAASPLHNSNATLPRKPHAAAAKPVVAAYHSQTDLQPQDDATAMLTESIGKINMGNKMDNFMAEAGKIISNMLEARLANGAPATAPASSSGSTLSLRSNSSSNLSHSPMVVRKRFDLDDFKDLDPTDPVSLKPVVAVQQQVSLAPKAPPQATKAAATLPLEVVPNHPMGKVLDLCDSNQKRHIVQQAIRPAGGKLGTLKPPVSPPSAAQPKPLAQFENKYAQEESLPQMETVVYRNELDAVRRRPSRELQNSTHAIDRRSYIEPNANNSVQANATNATATTTSTTTEDSINERPPFSVNVRALGPKADPNAPMSPENEEVVSQLLKDGKRPICCQCNKEITKGPFITALGRIWCPDHFHCVNGNCRRPLQDIGFVEEKGDLYCEYCFEKYLAPTCSKCAGKIKGDCLNAIGKHFHPECFTCGHCGKLFGNTPFFLEDGNAYCEADWNELFTTKCYACGFPVEAGDRWVEALNHNYHSQCFNCTYCKQNLEGQSFYNKGGRPFCKNHAR